ncbi:hypothetical protein ACSBR2_033380 [Camellia fascicularis]
MRGTVGYIAPEWWQARVTIKTNIYSFGIVLLEIVADDFDSTHSESRKHLLQVLQEKAKYQLIDIMENMDEGVKQYHAEEVLQGLMEVDTNINYNFTYAMASSSTVNNLASTAPLASVLSNPR